MFDPELSFGFVGFVGFEGLDFDAPEIVRTCPICSTSDDKLFLSRMLWTVTPSRFAIFHSESPAFTLYVVVFEGLEFDGFLEPLFPFLGELLPFILSICLG